MIMSNNDSNKTISLKVREAYTRAKERHMLHSLMAKGLNTFQAASVLGCSQPTVSQDLAWLRNYYKQQMLHYIENRLPELWESCLTQLHSTMAAVAKIAEYPDLPTHDKLHAHSLMVN
jgi:hypothetical protein